MTRIERFVRRVVDGSGNRPYAVLLTALAVLVLTWTYASRLELHTELLELLPRDSPGFQAFEHTLGRTGGRATLLILVESSDRKANERFIDDLFAKVAAEMDAHARCVAAAAPGTESREACGPDLIAYVEAGEKEVRQFYRDNRWLYASADDLERADETLDQQIAIRSGLVADLSGATEQAKGRPALGLDDFRARWEAQAKQHDDFPTGYFETPDGKTAGLRVISALSGMGDRAGDTLLARMKALASGLGTAAYAPDMTVGFAGDIANAVEEKDSLLSDALWATVIAFVLILSGVVFFFRSPWSLAIISLPAFIGVGCAYSFAMARYGYVNSTGAFLGAIIVGNGINYPIVLLARYREFRARGLAAEEARADAVWSAFRAELVGAAVGSIAYGSLVITRFRGFNQFGTIGFVGMLLVWLSMIPVVPALLVITERMQERLPPWLRDPPSRIASDGSRGPLTKWVARVTERRPGVVLGLAALLTAVMVSKVPVFLRDPWEYNFARLGSRGTKVGGAGEWSTKAERVFGGKMNIAGALMLADTPEQVPELKKQILANDAKDPEGALIAEVATVEDLLPGTSEEQRAKLAILARIRDRLGPRVLFELSEGERARVEEARPPESLHVLGPGDLPLLLRRRFQENGGRVGTVFYVRYRNDVSLSDGHALVRIAKSTDDVTLADGTVVETASRATIFAEMIRSMERDGPLATAASFSAVVLVVILATANVRGALAVLTALLLGVVWMLGGAAWTDTRLNFVNFIVLPITFGIGCEYPFNVYDRTRILSGDVSLAIRRTGGAVALCSYTTVVGYSSLLWNDFQSLQSFGRLAMSGEIACLAAALFVLPAILHVTGSFARRAAPAG
jgi:predicted RND superfamily exporter protein